MSPAASPFLAIGAAVLFISLGSLFVRLAEAPPLTVAFWRVALASLLLAPWAAPAALRSVPALSPRLRAALVASGLALALHFATWIASLSHTTVAASVLLVNTAPIFSVAFAALWLHERTGARELAALGLATAGAALVAFDDAGGGAHSLFGDGLALAGAATLSLYHVVGRGLRDALPLRAYVFAVWATAAAGLLVLALAFGQPLVGLAPRTWLALVALAVFPTLLGHGLVNRALRGLPAPTVGLFMLGEPVGAGLLAWAFLGETPGALTLAGGAVILAALVVLTRRGE